MKYVMMICGDESKWVDAPEAAVEDMMKEIYAWMEPLEKNGTILDGGLELDSSAKAKSVTRGPDGRPLVYDGPYLELKEVIGGFVILEADTIDDAVRVAGGWPGVARWGDRIEVRPVMMRDEG